MERGMSSGMVVDIQLHVQLTDFMRLAREGFSFEFAFVLGLLF